MKKTLLSTVLLSGTLIMTGCDQSNKVKAEDLMHHRFVLIKANGQDISPDKHAELEFGENMNISGQMCNYFTTKVRLIDDPIISPLFNITHMVCEDNQLDKLDTIITQLIQNGASVSLNKEQLTLKNKDNELIYQLKDLM